MSKNCKHVTRDDDGTLLKHILTFTLLKMFIRSIEVDTLLTFNTFSMCIKSLSFIFMQTHKLLDPNLFKTFLYSNISRPEMCVLSTIICLI